MKSPSDPPRPILTSLPDGAIRITVGGVSGTVHSDHLVTPKVAQVVAAWHRSAVTDCDNAADGADGRR